MVPDARLVGLVACSARKLDRRAPAADLYTGALFVKARRYVELTCASWHVLSALYGLVDPADELDPYDYSIDALTKAGTREGVTAWAAKINTRLLTLYNDATPTTFYLIAGADYRAPLVPLLSSWATVRELLAGLGYGAQMQALGAAARAHEAAP